MADVKQDPKKTESLLPKRCAERVRVARLSPEASVPPLPPGGKIEAGRPPVKAMAIHPWGLAVVCGSGETLLVPSAAVVSVVLAPEE